ncbi:MAG TPA: glycosyltransferase [Stellaceae bacterium]|nr:glycosyltransferase [Stellaceae bacterium]
MNDATLPEAAHHTARRGGLAGSTAVIVLGMHRSGTSALAGLLRHLGVALGDRLMAASPDNPRGYWEHLDIVAAHQDLMARFGRAWDDIRPLPPGYDESAAGHETRRLLSEILARDFAGTALWGVKDPRLCRLAALWGPLCDALAVAPRFVLVLRHPLEVAASLAGRDGIGAERALLLWLRHVLEAERATRGRVRTVVHYEDLVGHCGWRPVAARMAREIGVVWPACGPEVEAAIDSYLAPELRHHRAEAPGDGGAAMQGWVEAVHTAFAAPREEARLRAVCDVVGREIETADRLFLPIIGAIEQSQADDPRLARAEHETAELRALVSRKDLELNLWKRSAAAAGRAPLLGPLTAEEAYARWIESRASTALARADWIAERVAEWPYPPLLALGIVLLPGTETQLAATLRSLAVQNVGDWELHVVAAADPPASLAGERRLVWHRDSDPAAAALNRPLSQSAAHFVALIDAGDQLAPQALFSVADALFHHPEWGALYSDEDSIDPQGGRSRPHFKPDFNLDLLRSLPYVGGLLAVRREVFTESGGFDRRWDGAEEYDLALRLYERLGLAGVGHIADILYHRLAGSGRSRRPAATICTDMPKIVQAHLDRSGIAAEAGAGAMPYFCRVQYRHEGPEPLVSIIVPTRDQPALLKRCLETILKLTEYRNYELIVVDNGSTDAEACAYLQNIEDRFGEIGDRVRVLRHPGAFNFSAMNNRAVRAAARGEYLCLFNNDAAPLEAGWLGEMMMLARRPEIGIVGAKLFYADGRIQHGGVILGVGDGAPADHPYNGDPGDAFGYWGRLQIVQNFSAVTAACLVTRRAVYEQVEGLDEEAFAVAYNDIDYCLRVGAAGYLVVWTPFARLLHDGSASLRTNVERRSTADIVARFSRERLAMYQRWMPRIAFDPAYNRNLSSLGFGFAVESEGAPSWDPEWRPRRRALVYPADREGCGEYRVIAPARALFKAGAAHCYETMRLATPPELARIAPDSVVLQRQLEQHQIAFIEQLKHLSPALRIFELDDLITNLPLRSAHRRTIASDIGNRLKKALALCQRLVVSTAPLARAYGRWCEEVVVLPNRLEKSRWLGLAPDRREGGKPRVGWAGAIGHSGDLALIAGVVEATAKEVDWVFFGMCPDALRRHVAEFHPWVPLHDYARKLASLDLDLAVAPLEHHPFNEAKSNLRLLEYGVLGYPVVCTDILPYQGDLPVHRVANRVRDWTRAIRDMAADRDACHAAGESLRRAILADWLLEDHLDEWQQAWLP